MESKPELAMDTRITAVDVEAAFNMLLGRSPGPEGLAHFQKLAVDAGWTRRMLRDAIMASPEYRNLFGHPVHYDGFTLFVDPNEPDFGHNIVKYNGGYEEHNLVMLRKILKAGNTFVDIGANIGLLSLTARVAVGKSGKVICFEPMVSNATLLVKSIITNDFSNITVHPVALSDAERILYLEGNSNGMLRPDGRPERKMTTAVGDHYLDREDRIDLVKMDIEGHEPFALRGIAKALNTHKPMVMLEFNPAMLKQNSGWEATAFAEQIFELTPEVKVIDYDGGFDFVADVPGLMALWETKNRFFTDQGRISDGWLHFDLLFRVGSRLDVSAR